MGAEMSEMRGYAAAQAAYDAMTPPDDGPYECPECNGRGDMPDPADEDADYVKCVACDGFGMIDENGEPFDPHKAERDACDYADMKRDEQLTTYRGGADAPVDEGDY
jgi:hypothetical protein